jgi:anaerobic magnesium-protoporphyrin IX monomethyl ester cyclase
MRVLFTHSYFLRFDPKQWKTMQPYAPLGPMYAAAWLRQHGYEVLLHDVMFAEGPETVTPVLQSFKPEVLVIYDDGFNYLTKMCLTNMREAAFDMSALAKEQGCKVIISSSDSTDHFENYLQHGADYIIIGEGEQTLLELVNSLEAKETSQQHIQGLVFKENNIVVRTPARSVLHDLDSLPFPAWDLINVQQYRNAWKQSSGYFSINMGTTRGCPFKCNWCAKPIYGNRYNARSPENVVAELKMLQDKYHFDQVWFCDDIFGLKPGWVKKFAELVKKENLQFRYKIQARADLLLNDEQIKPLADSGCEIVWMGAESGSQKILDAMDKGTTIEQIEESTRLLKRHNIKPAFFLQFGYPGETIEDIKMTLGMLERLVPAEIGISVSYPLPGTKFYENVREQLKEKANWTDSDELVLMFHNTYSPEFYKQLHRYVHAHFRRVRARAFINDSKNSLVKRLKPLLKLPYYNWLAKKESTKLNKIQPLPA